MLDDFDLHKIQDLEPARKCIVMLLNLVETSKQENGELREEVQRLRDEINRLKGEQGKPDVKPNRGKKGQKDKPTSTNYSSEKERHRSKEHKKGTKLDKIKIDRTEKTPVDPKSLPADAEFKGYVDVVVQDITFETDNVLFRKEKYYSPSQGKTYLAPLPPGYEGEFGPGIRAFVITQYFGCNTTQPKILEFLHEVGIRISAGQLSNLLIKKHETFHEEKDAIYESGIRSSPWHHIEIGRAHV